MNEKSEGRYNVAEHLSSHGEFISSDSNDRCTLDYTAVKTSKLYIFDGGQYTEVVATVIHVSSEVSSRQQVACPKDQEKAWSISEYIWANELQSTN